MIIIMMMIIIIINEGEAYPGLLGIFLTCHQSFCLILKIIIININNQSFILQGKQKHKQIFIKMLAHILNFVPS